MNESYFVFVFLVRFKLCVCLKCTCFFLYMCVNMYNVYLHHLYKRHAYEEMVVLDSFLVGIVFDLALVCHIDFDLEHEVR